MDSLLDALGYIGSALDKPGRVVRGLLAGNSREGLAAIPFSDSLGLTDESQRTSGKGLLSALGIDVGSGTAGDAAGLGVEMATDPLSYLGVGLGAKLGGRAAEAAMARGPRYGTTADDLLGMIAKRDPEAATEAGRWMGAFDDPAAMSRVASEVPPGSEFLGRGQEAMAFRTPNNRVVRAGLEMNDAPGRPVAAGVLQADRAVNVPAGGATMRVENLPLAENVGDRAFWNTRNPETMMSRVHGLDQTLADQGLSFTDRHFGNTGTVGGRSAVIDPGALTTTKFKGEFQPVTQAGDPNMLMRLLIGLGGGDDAVRQAIESGGRPNFSTSLGALGGMGGAYSGVLARSLGG